MSRILSFASATLALAALLLAAPAALAADCPAFLNHDFKKLRSSQNINLCTEYAGKPLLIVNTASHCGYTPQFKGLEALHQKYKARLSPSAVTGSAANPVFQELGRRSDAPSWNFNKYLVRADGKVVRHFDSGVRPDSVELQQAIEQLLR